MHSALYSNLHIPASRLANDVRSPSHVAAAAAAAMPSVSMSVKNEHIVNTKAEGIQLQKPPMARKRRLVDIQYA